MTDDEKIVVGYQAAIEMINAGGADNWARFNALLVSNSVLLAATGFVLTEKLKVSIPTWVTAGIGCGFGSMLCLFWALLILRGDHYITYWNAVAREVEEGLGGFDLFRRGRLYGEGRTVEVSDGKNARPLQMPCLASIRSVTWMYLIIALFGVLYVIVLVVAVSTLPTSHPAFSGI